MKYLLGLGEACDARRDEDRGRTVLRGVSEEVEEEDDELSCFVSTYDGPPFIIPER